MKITRNLISTYVTIVIFCLTGIILIHFYYPFLYPYESHLLFAATSLLIAVIVSLFRKIPLNLNRDFRPLILFMGCYLGLMASNVFLSSEKTEQLMTDVVRKEIVTNTRNRDTHNYYALVKVSHLSLLGLNETARLRIGKKAFERLVPENHQARVEVRQGFLKQPYIVDFNFHGKNKKPE